MKNNIFLLMHLVFCFSFFAQKEEIARKIIDPIIAVHQIDSIQAINESWKIIPKITSNYGFFSDSALVNAEVGEFCIVQNINKNEAYLHKILSREMMEHCKVQYIFFNGLKYSLKEIDSLRAIILEAYANGVPFVELHKQYNEDGSQNGVLDWFYKGIMVKDFEDVVWERKKNEIFTVNANNSYWYYVVLKIEDNQMIEVTHSVGIRL
jgi:hypothetical protein